MSKGDNAPAVDRFIAAVEGAGMSAEVFCSDAVLDATVPNWRYSVRGADAIGAELGRWYADPGRFADLRRIPLPDGELIEFTLRWEEDGVTHTCHQAHHIEVRDGQVAKDTAWCGGRWPASLVAEMEAAAATG